MKVHPASDHSSIEEIANPQDVDARTVQIAPEQALWVLAGRGDPLAWKKLYDAHFDFVWRVSRRMGTPIPELEDVCQETFLVAFRKLADFGGGRFNTWLYRIAANVVSDRHRRRRVRRALHELWGAGDREPMAELNPERQLESRQAERFVGAVLERMAPKKREVFVLFELDGRTGDEIAELVGCKVETVWTRLHYARKEFESIARKRGGAALMSGSRT